MDRGGTSNDGFRSDNLRPVGDSRVTTEALVALVQAAATAWSGDVPATIRDDCTPLHFVGMDLATGADQAVEVEFMVDDEGHLTFLAVKACDGVGSPHEDQPEKCKTGDADGRPTSAGADQAGSLGRKDRSGVSAGEVHGPARSAITGGSDPACDPQPDVRSIENGYDTHSPNKIDFLSEPRQCGKTARLATIRAAGERLKARNAPAPRLPLGGAKVESQVARKPDWIAQRAERLNGAIAFLRSRAILVSVADRATMVRRYRVTGKRETQLAEDVIELAQGMGWEGAQ